MLYKNPLVSADFPDPSVLYTASGMYYAYATHDQFSPTLPTVLVRHSPDMVHWSEAGGALLAPPVWARQCQRFWCPQVVYVNGEYRLYYAAESDAKDGMHLALATSDKPYDFVDIGEPLTGSNGTDYAMIDPCFFADPQTGRHYLYYGSAHEPIRAIELAPDGRTFIGPPADVLWPRPGVQFETLREGAFITYQPAYQRYLLWVSGDNTWAENGYAVSVYWSADPLRGFTAIPDPHVILRANDYWDSPGQACVLTDAAGDDWLIYHAVDKTDRFTFRAQPNFCERCVWTGYGMMRMGGLPFGVIRLPRAASQAPPCWPESSPSTHREVIKKR